MDFVHQQCVYNSVNFISFGNPIFFSVHGKAWLPLAGKKLAK